MTERQLRDAVVACARTLGWLCYWTWNSKHSPAGMPDLTMVRDGRLVFAELKVGRNTPTPAQWEWLSALGSCGVEAYLWTDREWLSGEVERILRQPGIGWEDA